MLAESDAASADEALEIFAFRVAREAAALATTIGGIDALVFTGGIGEHQPDKIGRAWCRGRVCQYVSCSAAGLSLKKKTRTSTRPRHPRHTSTATSNTLTDSPRSA